MIAHLFRTLLALRLVTAVSQVQALQVAGSRPATDEKAEKVAASHGATPPSSAKAPAIADPLLRILVNKGMVTTEEADSVGASGALIEQRDRLIPDVKLGRGASVKPYGFFKTSLTYDSSSPRFAAFQVLRAITCARSSLRYLPSNRASIGG
jgi:hypothetical protein